MADLMIERVVAAIYKEDPTVMEMLSNEDIRDLACAAIKAMREASPKMLLAGVRETYVSEENVCCIYKSMIDAALAEAEPDDG